MADLIVGDIGDVVSVTLTHGYTDNATLSAYLGPLAAGSTTQVDAAINAASRAIDAWCNRQFWLDASPVARTFVPTGLYCLEVDDIGDDTTVTLKTDATGDGVFETTWAAADFQLLPYNAPTDGPEPAPWTSIQAVGSHLFPWIGGAYLRRVNRVEVTARWGWPAVPDAVTEACIIKAASLFHRKNSPQGVIAFDEFGAVRLGRGEDKDVISLLAPYRLDPILMA